MKKLLGIMVLGLLLSGNAFAKTYWIETHKLKLGKGLAQSGTYWVICIDGHKFIHQDKRPVVQVFEERDGKSLPAKC